MVPSKATREVCVDGTDQVEVEAPQGKPLPTTWMGAESGLLESYDAQAGTVESVLSLSDEAELPGTVSAVFTSDEPDSELELPEHWATMDGEAAGCGLPS